MHYCVKRRCSKLLHNAVIISLQFITLKLLNIILECLPSLCQKLSDFVEVIVITKIILLVFFLRHVVSVEKNPKIGLIYELRCVPSVKSVCWFQSSCRVFFFALIAFFPLIFICSTSQIASRTDCASTCTNVYTARHHSVCPRTPSFVAVVYQNVSVPVVASHLCLGICWQPMEDIPFNNSIQCHSNREDQ